MRNGIAILVSGTILAGCGFADDVQAPEAHVFEGTFTALTDELPDVGGSVAALSQASTTEVTFSIHGLEPESEVSWALKEGVCGSAGEPVVDPEAFPAFEADEQGGVRTGDDGMADPDDPGGTQYPNPQFVGQLDPDIAYVVELYQGDTVEGDPIACADLGEGEDPGEGTG